MTDTPDATPQPASTPSLADLEQRLSRIEEQLATFFDAIATDRHKPQAAAATAEAGSGPAAAVPRPPVRGDGGADELARALRHRIEGYIGWERLTPAQVLAMFDAALRRLETEQLETDAQRLRAERLATKLLLEKDGAALWRRGAKAGCWDAEGRLIGAGATLTEALRAATEVEGPEAAETWLVALVSDCDTTQPSDPAADRIAEFDRLASWLVDKIDSLPAGEADAAVKRLEDALIAADAPRVRAERLATTLLLERDGEALRWNEMRAGCWDAEGVLIGAGATRAAALRDAAEQEGAGEAETWLVAEVPVDGEERLDVDPALWRIATMPAVDELVAAISRRLDAMPADAALTAAEVRAMIDAALADLRNASGD